MRGFLTLLLAGALLTSKAASAEEHSKLNWYGWQILAADGGVAAGAYGVHGLLGIGWTLTGPIIHEAHGNGGRSLLSAALRIGLPIVGGALYAHYAQCKWDPNQGNGEHNPCFFPDLDEFGIGAQIGMAAASFIDVAALSWSYKPATDTAPTRAKGPSLAPSLSLGGSSANFGIVGRF